MFPEEKGQTESKSAHVETPHRLQTWITLLPLFLLSEADSSASCSILFLHVKEKQKHERQQQFKIRKDVLSSQAQTWKI